MRRELIDLAATLADRGEPFALATVIARSPPISAQVGDAAVVTGDGGFHGWVGGSCTRPTVIAEAQKALADGQPRLVALDPDPDSRRRPGLTVFPMTCHSGGSVEIHIQPVLPPPRLLIYGVSPTARALVRLGKAMGYVVVLIDPSAEAADFPDADAVLTDAAAVGAQRGRRAVDPALCRGGDAGAVGRRGDRGGAGAGSTARLSRRDGQRKALRRDARAACGHGGRGGVRPDQEPGRPGPGRDAARGDRDQHPGGDRRTAARRGSRQRRDDDDDGGRRRRSRRGRSSRRRMRLPAASACLRLARRASPMARAPAVATAPASRRAIRCAA